MTISRLNNWLWPDNFNELSGRQRRFRQTLRFLFILFAEFRRDRINLRAAALTYSVVLSLVPMLALSTAILKGMGAGDQMHQAAYKLIDNLSDTMPAAAPAETQPAAAPAASGKKKYPPDQKQQAGAAKTSAITPATSAGKPVKPKLNKDFSAHLYEAVDKIFAYVNRTNFAALGIIGTFLLLITVLIVINGIEEALNAIWQVDKSRSPGRKFMNYMALIIVCPLTINLGLGATTMLNAPAIAVHIDKFFPIAWVQGVIFKLVPIALLTLTFFLLYYFLPNLKIRAKAAWCGSLAGALGLITLQKIFILLQIGVANYNAIYGSFATVPLFLLWIHSTWLVFLLGAEVAFTSQHFRNYHINGRHLPPGPEMALTFDLINEIYRFFDQRRAATLKALSAATGESAIAIEKILKRLSKAGLISLTDKQPATYLPASPPTGLKPEEITALLWGAEKAKPASFGRKLAAKFFKGGNKSLSATNWNESTCTSCRNSLMREQLPQPKQGLAARK